MKVKFEYNGLPSAKSWDPELTATGITTGDHSSEFAIKKEYHQHHQGWLVTDIDGDMNLGAYTPLHMSVTYTTPTPVDMLALTKTLQDALVGVAYIDDCSIVSLCLKQQRGKPHTSVYILPASEGPDYRDMDHAIHYEGYLKMLQSRLQQNGEIVNKGGQSKTNTDILTEIKQTYIEQGGLICTGNRLQLVLYSQIRVCEPLDVKRNMLTGKMRPVSRLDLDNFAHTITSGLDGIAYLDRSQLEEIRVAKYYGTSDRHEYLVS